MAAGLLAIAPLLIQTVMGLVGKGKHDQYANELEGMDRDIPSGIREAEEVYDLLATGGLAGKDLIQSGIRDEGARAMAESKDVLAAYPDVFGYLTRVQSGVSEKLRQTDIADSTMKIENQLRRAGFLSGPKAAAEEMVERFDIDKQISAGQERMIGTSELMRGVSQGISSGITTFSNLSYLENQKKRLEMMKSFWGTGEEEGINIPEYEAPAYNPEQIYDFNYPDFSQELYEGIS